MTRDLPAERLKRGDIVKLVEHHVARDGEDGYSAEVFNALGETLTVNRTENKPTAAKQDTAKFFTVSLRLSKTVVPSRLRACLEGAMRLPPF